MMSAVLERPASQKHEDLVPSRYAVKVGEFDVLVISDGVLPITTQTLATNASEADLSAWLEHYFLPQQKIDWPLNVLLIRTQDRTILVDSGLGSQFPGFPRAGQTPARLEAAGIDLASITDIVITHMHMDHVGGLLVDGLKERLSPDVRIHVCATEVDFWTNPDFARTDMPKPVPPVLRATAKSFVEKYQHRFELFDEEREVIPGVVVRRTGGHTPGHSVVYVNSGDDKLLFAGDAMFQVNFDHNEWHNGFEHDPEESVQVRIRLYQELAKTGALLVATHLPFPSVGRVAIDGDAFRYVPVNWDY